MLNPGGRISCCSAFDVSNSFNRCGDFNLQRGHRLPWIKDSGLEWRNDVVLGSQQASLHTELRKPIWNTVGLYVVPYAEYGRRHLDLYLNDDATSTTVPGYRLSG